MSTPYSVPLSDAAKNFKPGLYRHYKGDVYRAWMVGRLSESRHEEMIVYTGLEFGLTWIRPIALFLETIEVDGVIKQRFERIGE